MEKYTKRNIMSMGLFIIASVFCKITYEYSDRAMGEFAIVMQIFAALLLLLAVANYAYQFYKSVSKHDEFIQYTVMKGACFGGIMTGAVSWFYSCFGSSVPQYQAEWPFYMLLVFTAIGHSYFIRKAS